MSDFGAAGLAEYRKRHGTHDEPNTDGSPQPHVDGFGDAGLAEFEKRYPTDPDAATEVTRARAQRQADEAAQRPGRTHQ